jgi:diguanylate cyclase (GGDEF)-like protein
LKLQHRTFGSSVARRVFAMLIVCAFVPVGIFAAYTLLEVQRTVAEQQRGFVASFTKSFAEGVLDRLLVVDGLVADAAREMRQPRPMPQARGGLWAGTVDAVLTVDTTRDVRTLAGRPLGCRAPDAPPDEPLVALRFSRPVLLHCGHGPRLALVSNERTQTPGDGSVRLILVPHREYLWGDDDTLPSQMELAVFSRDWEDLHAAGKPGDEALSSIREVAGHSVPAHLQFGSAAGRRIAHVRDVPIASRAGQRYLVVASIPVERGVGLTLREFALAFLPLALLTLGLVGLLGVRQIRNLLAPLDALIAATRKLARGQFDGRVQLTRRDEFGELGEAFNLMSGSLGRQFHAMALLSKLDQLILSRAPFEQALEALRLGLPEGSGAIAFGVLARAAGQAPAAFRFAGLRPAGALQSAAGDCEVCDEEIDRIAAHPDGLVLDGSHLRRLPEGFTSLCGAVLAFPIGRGPETSGVLLLGHPSGAQAQEEEQRFARDLADRLAVGLDSRKREEQLYRQSHYDGLTSLMNRASFRDLVASGIVDARVRGEGLAILFIGMNRFRSVNESLGHSSGDELIISLADRLRGAMPGAARLARWSGDEFACILPRADAGTAGDLAQRLREVVLPPHELAAGPVSIDISVGVALHPSDAAGHDELLRAAYLAMQRSKESGSGFAFFEARMNEALARRRQLETEMQIALERGEFELFFQPKVALRDRRLVSAEALLRWRHPQRGLVSPAEFIPLAEELGLIVPMGAWAIEEAGRKVRDWRDLGGRLQSLAVNLSLAQLRDPGLLEQAIARARADFAAAGVALELEVTESAIAEGESVVGLLARIASQGVTLALDDFGTGYSSLSHLRHLPVSIVKVDQSFVRDLPDNAQSRALALAIISMAHALGKHVVAEGIEHEAQASLLRDWGAEIGQGWLFGKPVPAADFASLLLREVDTAAAA